VSSLPEHVQDGATKQLNLVTTINETLRDEMRRDESICLLGYDIGPIGGIYRTTESLHEEFGGNRVIDTPLSENGIIGTAVGMAMRGTRVVPEIQFMGFFYPAFGQFMYTLAKMHHRTGGNITIPITVRVPYGGGIRASEYHSESTETFLVHTPGCRVVTPSTPREAKGLLAASIRSDDPVFFLEPKKIYRGTTEAVPEDSYTLSLDDSRYVRRGSDVTIFSWGAMVRYAKTAADSVDADVEIVDLRTLWPLDVETILESVKKTGRVVVLHEARRTLGLGAELSALVNEYALDRLRAPVKRATGFDVHFPGHETEDAYMPDEERARHAIQAVMQYEF